MTLLDVRYISKQFGTFPVLKNISLEFQPGTVTAIVGDNGAGKSTFLKTLAGVHTPENGTITLNSHNLVGLSPEKHRSFGVEMVYQDLALASHQDLPTNLFIGREKRNSFGFLCRKTMRREAIEILHQLGIEIPDIRRNVGLLSGGQQQAIAIARAILFHPSVLLFDEPTAALAVREVDRVLELIRQQKEQGRIIILVSHRLNDVFAVADRIVVLKHGCVFSDDRIENVTLPEIVQRIVS